MLKYIVILIENWIQFCGQLLLDRLSLAYLFNFNLYRRSDTYANGPKISPLKTTLQIMTIQSVE